MGTNFNVYVISSTETESLYFGVTEQDIDNRMDYHLRALRYQRHTCEDFQHEFNENPFGWSISLVAQHSTKQAALDHEGSLIAANAGKAMNVYKNPQKARVKVGRISEALAMDILSCKGEGYTYEIAEQFNVSQPIVSKIWRGDHWSSRFALDDGKYELAMMVAELLQRLNANFDTAWQEFDNRP